MIDLVATTTDPAAEEIATQDVQAHMWKQMWHVPLYNSDFTVATTAKLEGLDVRPNFKTRFDPASLVP